MIEKDYTTIEKIKQLRIKRAQHVQAIEEIDYLLSKYKKAAVSNDAILTQAAQILGRLPYGNSQTPTPHA